MRLHGLWSDSTKLILSSSGLCLYLFHYYPAGFVFFKNVNDSFINPFGYLYFIFRKAEQKMWRGKNMYLTVQSTFWDGMFLSFLFSEPNLPCLGVLLRAVPVVRRVIAQEISLPNKLCNRISQAPTPKLTHWVRQLWLEMFGWMGSSSIPSAWIEQGYYHKRTAGNAVPLHIWVTPLMPAVLVQAWMWVVYTVILGNSNLICLGP